MTPSLYSWQIAHCHAEVVRKFASKWVMALGGGMVAGVAVTCQWQRAWMGKWKVCSALNLGIGDGMCGFCCLA